MRSFLNTLKVRLQSCPDGETGQAIVRFAIGGAVLAYLTIAHAWRGYWTPRGVEVVQAIGGYWLVAIALLIAIAWHPRRNVPRRLVAMLADVGASTWYMATAGDFGFFAVGFYLFIVFSHGFRYGYRYLIGCQLLCLLGMCSVLVLVPFWGWHRVAGGALLTTLVVIPLYVGVMLRWHETRAQDGW
jgi:two-component system sensor histidine kinase RpfC